jgi:maleylpyruvate isomerase
VIEEVPASAVPAVEIAGCARAHAALADRIEGLEEKVARRPSRLPGWSVGHVLTHLARNADSVVRRLAAAAEGRVVDQYPGGAQGRHDEIEEGAGRSPGHLVADVLRSNREVDALLAAYPADAWDRPSRSVAGRLLPASGVVLSRWIEVEVHHVDLGIGYEPRDWPDVLVDRWLPMARERFLEPVDRQDLLAWLVGRGPAPKLAPWE